ncbi:hypothetical protein CGRA01v4_00849 [Colletotrichum graminicola]|nr:hypothetical protein CGRA01v4_00849 [Colletotrichum graminicola]
MVTMSTRSSIYFCYIHHITVGGRRMVQEFPVPPFSLLYAKGPERS